ncbi:MAG: proton-conducting transporter membrane subunit [Elusimicrobiales bacterium]|nr:proton-conducting transporter membrane subunit [Elusimicrobiales bacterium]
MNELNSNISNLVLIPLLLPLISGVLLLLISDKTKYLKEVLSFAVTGVSFAASIVILKFVLESDNLQYHIKWLGNLSSISFRIDQLSAFLLFGVSMFSLLLSLYGISVKNRGSSKIFYFLLMLTQTAAAGSVISDNLISMLFFWESMVVLLYVFVYISGETQACKKTALKTFLINGISDIAMMLGIIIIGYISDTFLMSKISQNKLILSGWGTVAYVLLLIGALTKAGAFPFHTWIPDAALNSNAAFMAYIPAAIDKLLGIYFLARISLYIYQINSTMQIILMSIGAITILVAVMMAFIQNDYKRLLSYHAVSQTGYMILGIGTLNPVGIAGGLFHMINHASYKSCLFMTAGAVENQTQTNDISKLGGLFSRMPITAVCFIIAAAAISGIAPLNGFFSKELVDKGTIMSGYTIFFYAAEIGSILTLASFLKLGHSVFFGKTPENLKDTKEAPYSMLIPMIALAAICVIFGFGAHLPISKLISPSLMALGFVADGELSGFHFDNLFLLSLVVIIIAVSNHILGFRLSGKAYKSSDHIHYAPVLHQTYDMAEKGYFDLYEIFRKIFSSFSSLLFKIDRFFDKLIDDIPVSITLYVSDKVSKLHSGSYSLYMFFIFVFATAYLIYLGGIKW